MKRYIAALQEVHDGGSYTHIDRASCHAAFVAADLLAKQLDQTAVPENVINVIVIVSVGNKVCLGMKARTVTS